ncbi:hypothetical protein ACLVWU_08520 [Bdellovibrio sp. HCB290]|uniref:hypothetical protein n=1 Tax=Bdellovibrio sp. HCB290 TaxID=3394356 RepID=UPI0039B687C2
MNIKILISLIAVFLSLPALAKISITSPKVGEWLPPLDEDRQLQVSGTSDLPAGTDLILTTGSGKSWTSKTRKDGSFSFEFSQLTIPALKKTILTVMNLEKTETSTQEVYCCSMESVGFHTVLSPVKSYEFKVKQPGFEIDGLEITIPKNAVTTEGAELFASKAFADGINLAKYVPLSPAIAVIITKIKTRTGIQYSFTIDPRTPRNETTSKVSADDWSQVTNRAWQDIDLKKAKLVVLATGLSGHEWTELSTGTLRGNTFTFKQLEGEKTFTTFVIAARVTP